MCSGVSYIRVVSTVAFYGGSGGDFNVQGNKQTETASASLKLIVAQT